MRLLLAEDDRDLTAALERGLREEGYVVDVAHRGDDALHLLQIYDYAAAILDWRMPGLAGDEVVRRARSAGLGIPILLLTARDTTGDKVRGLDAGADDYVVKPVDFDELVARLRAIQRRLDARPGPNLEVGDVALDPAGRLATVAGAPIELTPRQLAILEVLLRRSPAVVDRAAIARHAWEDEASAIGSNAIDVHVSQLRRKLTAAGALVMVVTVRGAGYRLQPR